MTRDQNNQGNYHQDHDDDRARAREGMNLIIDAFHANIGPMMTRAAANVIEEAMRAGIDTDSVIMAIEQTGLAPQPSARYLAAILRNWQRQGYVTQNYRRKDYEERGNETYENFPFWTPEIH